MQNTDREAEVVLVENARIVRIFERITFYVKSKEQRILLGVLLKTSRLFIEAFRKHSIPYFTRVFKNHKEDVVAIFKDFQGTTRMLQVSFTFFVSSVSGAHLILIFTDYLFSCQSFKRGHIICLCAAS